MEILIIIILFCLMLYAFGRSGRIKKETAQKDAQITALNQEIGQLKTEISGLQSDKTSLNDKIQRLRAELSNLQIDKRETDQKNLQLKNQNDALSKYQDILNVQMECEYLLKKAEKRQCKIKGKSTTGAGQCPAAGEGIPKTHKRTC